MTFICGQQNYGRNCWTLWPCGQDKLLEADVHRARQANCGERCCIIKASINDSQERVSITSKVDLDPGGTETETEVHHNKCGMSHLFG